MIHEYYISIVNRSTNTIPRSTKMRILKTVFTNEIDTTDTTFLITFIPDLEPLLASLRLVGLVEPLILRGQGADRYQIVCGFKRAEALRLLDLSEAEAFVYPPGVLDDLHALLLQVGHNLSRPLNLMEKAQALKKLVAFGVPEKEVIDRYLPLFGLQPNMRVLKQVTGLVDLECGVQEYLVREGLSLSASVLFLSLGKDGQRAILPLLEALRPGENRIKEIISFMREIALRDRTTVSSLCAGEDISTVLSDLDTPRSQRVEQLRGILKHLRFPRLTALEDTFADYKRSLALPPQISLHPPPFFEAEQFRMEMRFKDFATFRELVTTLHQIAEKGHRGEDPLRELMGVR
jgi:hypothetical protein